MNQFCKIASILSLFSPLPLNVLASEHRSHHLRRIIYDGFEEDGVTPKDPTRINSYNDDRELTAVLHIGPMKTGSSAIQASLGSVVPVIETIDNYEDAGFALDDGIEAYHMIGCFRPDADPYTGGKEFEISCHPDALNQVARVAERKHNLIITAEYLTDPKTDLQKMKEFLKPWKKHRIVAYYRRYYDWLLSFHNQVMKQRKPSERIDIVTFLSRESMNRFFWNAMYLVTAVDRYQKYFDDIHIINLYDLPGQDARQSFYCDALPNAHASCEQFKEYLKTEPPHVENPSVSLIYSELAFYSKENGLWTETAELTEKVVTKLAHQFQKNVLNRTAYEFGTAVVCPTERVYDELLTTSLNVEKNLFPNYYNSKGEQEIRTHYSKVAPTKMCHVHAKIVLDTYPEWQLFFQQLNVQGKDQILQHMETIKAQAGFPTSSSSSVTIQTELHEIRNKYTPMISNSNSGIHSGEK